MLHAKSFRAQDWALGLEGHWDLACVKAKVLFFFCFENNWAFFRQATLVSKHGC